MANKKTTSTEEQLHIARSPLHQKYYATNVKGGFTSQDFRFELLNEIIGDEKQKAYISDALVILSPIGAKRFLDALSKSVSEYEKKNGEIPLNPDNEPMVDFSK